MFCAWCSHGIAHSSYFLKLSGRLVQQGWVGLDELSSQAMIPFVVFQDHGWLQVAAPLISRVHGQPIHRTSATV